MIRNIEWQALLLLTIVSCSTREEPVSFLQEEVHEHAADRITLRGRVLAKSGEPIHGAFVQVASIQTRSGADGGFELEVPNSMAARYPLGAAAEGYAPRLLAEARSDDGSELRVILDQPALRITGRVMCRDRTPLAGWRIYRLGGLLVDSSRVPPVFAEDLTGETCITTDENGEFAVEGLAGTVYRILACDSQSLDSVEADVNPSRDGPMVLVVEHTPLRPLEAELVSADGSSLPNVEVALALVLWEGTTALSSAMDLGTKTVSDDEGRFHFERVPRGERVRLFVGSQHVMPSLIPLGELSSPHPRVRCERLIRFRFVGLERADARWSEIAFGAEDASGSPVTVLSFLGGDWSFARMLPASMAADAIAGVAESAHVLVLYHARKGKELRRVDLSGATAGQEVVDIDIGKLLAEPIDD